MRKVKHRFLLFLFLLAFKCLVDVKYKSFGNQKERFILESF